MRTRAPVAGPGTVAHKQGAQEQPECVSTQATTLWDRAAKIFLKKGGEVNSRGRVSDGDARVHPKAGSSGLDVGHSIRSYYKDVSNSTCPFSSMIL